MLDNPTSLSELIKQVIAGYDEIKAINTSNKEIKTSVENIKQELQTQLSANTTNNEKTKQTLAFFDEKIQSIKENTKELENKQALIKNLFNSIDNLVQREQNIIRNVDTKISSYNEYTNINKSLMQELKELKSASEIALSLYKQDSTQALNDLNNSISIAQELIKTFATKDKELQEILKDCKKARDESFSLNNEIKTMRKRSQCLISKAEELLAKYTNIETILNENIAKIENAIEQSNERINESIRTNNENLEQNINKINESIILNSQKIDEKIQENITKINNAIEQNNTKINNAIDEKNKYIDTLLNKAEQIKANNTELNNHIQEQTSIINNLLSALNGKDFASVLNELKISKDENTLLNENIQAIKDIKTELTQVLNEKMQLNNYYMKSEVYSKAESDEKISELERNIQNSYYTKIQTDEKIQELTKNKANASDLANYYLKNETYSQDEINSKISNLDTNKTNKSDLINYYNKSQTDEKIQELTQNKANTSDLVNYYLKNETYTQEEVNNKINDIKNSTYQVVSNALSVRVGASEQFQTIRQAISYLLKYRFNSVPVKHKIILAESFSPVQEYFYYEDLSFIEITSEGREIIINKEISNNYFYYFYYCKAPYFYNVNFRLIQENKKLILFDSTEAMISNCNFSSTKTCLELINSSLRVFATTINNSTNGIFLQHSSKAYIYDCNFINLRYAIVLYSISKLFLNNSTFNNITERCLDINEASVVYYEKRNNLNNNTKSNIEINDYTINGFLCDTSVKTTKQEQQLSNALTQVALQNTQISQLLEKCQNLLTKIERGGGKVGMIFLFSGKNIPQNYFLCDGRELKKSEYPELFAAIGILYGESTDKTSFKLPDLRGKFTRCVGGNADVLGQTQTDAMRNITGYIEVDTLRKDDTRSSGVFSTTGYEERMRILGTNTSFQALKINFNASSVVPTADEFRPINMAMNYIIQVRE